MPSADDRDLEEYFRECQKVKEVAHLTSYTSLTNQAMSILTGSAELFNMACMLTKDADGRKERIERLHRSLSSRYGIQDREELFQKGKKAAVDNQMSILQDQVEIGCQYVKTRKIEIAKYAGMMFICNYIIFCCNN